MFLIMLLMFSRFCYFYIFYISVLYCTAPMFLVYSNRRIINTSMMMMMMMMIKRSVQRSTTSAVRGNALQTVRVITILSRTSPKVDAHQ